MTILKSDIINGAYSRMRVSGITVGPSAADNSLALPILEGMASEWLKRGYDTGYKFTDDPDTGDPSGIDISLRYAFETALAVRLVDDFGKPIPPSLQRNHEQSFSALAAIVTQVQEVDYPTRMPRGSGTTLRYNRWQRFQRPTEKASLDTSSNTMWVGEQDSFFEDYKAYLDDGEAVTSVTIEADDGLTVVTSALNSDGDRLDYTVSAVGASDGSETAPKLKITAVTDATTPRTNIRFVNFELKDEDVG